MNTRIQADGFTADNKLTEFIELKLQKLPTYFDKIIDVEVKLQLDSHQQIKDKVINIKCNIPGSTLFVASTAKSFEEATDEAVSDISRQLKKKNQIIQDKNQKEVSDMKFGL